MKAEDTKDLSNFFAELQRETDRGLPLVAAALIDEKLMKCLKSFFCSGKAANHLLTEPNAPLGNFSSRIETCFALGLIDDFEYEEITLIRKIRNGFAHSTHGFSFKDERVKGLCSSLRSDLPEGSGYPLSEARFRFINSVICIVLRLYYRDAWVGKERRKPKTWVEPDQSRWYSVDEKRPPVNIPVVAMVKRVKKY